MFFSWIVWHSFQTFDAVSSLDPVSSLDWHQYLILRQFLLANGPMVPLSLDFDLKYAFNLGFLLKGAFFDF